MATGPIRRAQLIAPFGVGSLVVGRDGIGLISGGLDHWYEMEDGSTHVNLEDFIVEEWRLQANLGVRQLRLPPDYRQKRYGEDIQNIGMTVPFLRFPQWHFCPSCNLLKKSKLSEHGRIKCPQCEEKKKTRFMYQVPFVAMCDRGHLQDFPWREWVHRSLHTDCQEPMHLIATGGTTLAAQWAKCDCGAERSLAQITEAYPDGGTYLSNNLVEGSKVLCSGSRPWLGTEDSTKCSRPIRGSLRSASNLYFAQVRSAIYVPRHTSHAASPLVALLEQPPISTLIKALLDAGVDIKPDNLRRKHSLALKGYSDTELGEAIAVVTGQNAGGTENTIKVQDDDPQTAFRRLEFNVLRLPQNEEDLIIKSGSLNEYDPEVSRYFSSILLIEKLRETRALVGFTRVFPENDESLEEWKPLMWRNPPQKSLSWLPAYVVRGEGIFLEFDGNLLHDWETEAVKDRVQPLIANYRQIQQDRRLHSRPISARFVLLHTFSHLLMNRLTFECGYSSAALRERLFVSTDPGHPMAGVLIYTAAGDAEGTMGGLVRMGKKGNLEPTIRRAIEGAHWCSADPVCMEIGSHGQGPDSCNLAACHNCALVPETACEEFNRFLDRGLVVGTPENEALGYFSSK